MLTHKMQIPVGLFEVGSVIDIEYPYEECSGTKLRPAVIIEKDEERTVAVSLKITSSSRYEDETRYPYAVKISDLDVAGLKKNSWVLSDKELVLNQNCKLYLKGHLSEKDIELVSAIHLLAISDNRTSRLTYEED